MRATIDTIEVDALITEKPVRRMEITTHPVEDGSDPADHSRILPEVVNLVGSITDINLSGSPATATPRQAGYSDQQRKALEALQDTHAVFNITTSRKVYRDMMLTELSWESSSKTGGELAFNATATAVILVSNTGVVLTRPPPPPSTVQQPNGTSSQPKQAGTVTDDSSIAKGFLNSLGVSQVGSGRAN